MGRGNVYRDTVAQMGKDGWLTLSWPKEFGGQDRPPMDGLIFNDEASIANVPVPFLTINSVAPTIMHFGTDEQKKFFLPKIAAGELHFSIGYSEPGAGTDLAALRTTAVRDGDDYVDQRPEDVDQPDRLRRLRLAGRAHQPRGQEAPRHLDADRADHGRGLLLDAGAHHVRRRHQRHLLPGRPRPDVSNLVGEENARLEAGHQPAQPRARRPGLGAADLLGARRGSRVGAEHQGRPRQAADRLGVGAAQPRSRARQGRGAQADQLGAGLHARPRRRPPTRRRPRCTAPSWPPRPTGC